jgi:hypothetical protein
MIVFCVVTSSGDLGCDDVLRRCRMATLISGHRTYVRMGNDEP